LIIDLNPTKIEEILYLNAKKQKSYPNWMALLAPSLGLEPIPIIRD
jgi:hypothetical protein